MAGARSIAPMKPISRPGSRPCDPSRPWPLTAICERLLRSLGLRHERIALLPRHRGEAAAFLSADLVENNLAELAFRCAAERLWLELRLQPWLRFSVA